MEWRRDQFLLTDDPARFDMDFISAALQTTYWAKQRPREVIEASFQHALGFALLDGKRQIGVCRIVTDRCTFSWLADVFIDPTYRGRGLAVWMVGCVLSHPYVATTKVTLATRDAQAVYERFGFVNQTLMRRKPPTDAAADSPDQSARS